MALLPRAANPDRDPMTRTPDRSDGHLDAAIGVRTRGAFPRYVVACTLVAFALLCRCLLAAWAGVEATYLLFYPAIVVAAWHGGLGPGLAATGVSAGAAAYLLESQSGWDRNAVFSFGLFVATGLVISWLNHRLTHGQRSHRSAAVTANARAERLEERLGASEARWRAVIDSAVDGIVVIDAHGRVETFNPAAERLFGYAAQDVIGHNVAMLMPSPHREEHDAYVSRYLATGQARVIGVGREVAGRRADGSTFPLHLSVAEITLEGQRKFTGILHDLSERVRMEGQLREQTALARLGEMAAVVAHEVKNPLAGIRGAMQVFASRTTGGGADTEILKEIVSRIDSLDQMMKDMLLFARPPKLRLTLTDVVPLVTATAHLLRQDPAWCEVEVDLAGAAPPVLADPDMLRIVFQNLLINSAHAMKGKGRISVAIDAVDGVCRVAFADNGPGIPPDVLPKVFTPFFTTKSRGSGLGLPTARQLIEAHGGEISVDCPPSGGTTVVVRLPAAE